MFKLLRVLILIVLLFALVMPALAQDPTEEAEAVSPVVEATTETAIEAAPPVIVEPAPIEVTVEQPKEDLLSPYSLLIMVLTGALVVALILLSRSYPAQTKELLGEVSTGILNTLERQAAKTASPLDDALVAAGKAAAGNVLSVEIPSEVSKDEALQALAFTLQNLIMNKQNPPSG